MKTDESTDMRTEYHREDLGTGVRGKHHDDFKKGTNLILLSPDVAAAFPDDESVNNALRGLLDLAKRTMTSTKRSSKQTKVGS
jgi:hypothetical protein